VEHPAPRSALAKQNHPPRPRPAMQPLLLALAIFAGLCVDVEGADSFLFKPKGKGKGVEDPEAIHEKYDKMDEFIKTMFTIGCKWKHGKDVHNYAAQGLKDGSMTTDEFEVELVATQDKELVALKQACGFIDASQRKKCRSGCATRWNAMMAERDSCDSKCEKNYDSFEKKCLGKADDLKTIYELTAKLVAAKKKCYTSWCAEFPTIHVMSNKKDMTKERKKRCEDYCDKDKIEMRCQKKFQLEIDFVMAGIKSECAEESGIGECFAKGKKKVNKKQESCKEEADSTCEEAYDKCAKEADGQAREAKAFCDKRMKMCDEQATAKCLKAHEAATDELKKTCEEKGKEAFEKCKKKGMEKEEKKAMEECSKEKGKACPSDCRDKCRIGKMTDCLDNLKQPDGTKDFCEDFWRLIEESTEIDPKTGDPKIDSLEFNEEVVR